MSQPIPEPQREITLPVLLGLAALSAALHGLALPPADLGGLAFVALVPLLVGMRLETRLLRATTAGLVFGIGTVVAVVHWIPAALVVGNGFAPAAAWLLSLLVFAWYAVWFALFPWLVARLDRSPLPYVLCPPLAWVSIETLRDAVLPGLAWTLYGHSQHSVLPILQFAEWAGVSGLSFALVLLNSLIAEALVVARRGGAARRIAIPLAVASGLGAAMWTVGTFRLAEVDAARAAHLEDSIPVAAVQIAIPQSERWQPDEAWPRIDALLELSGAAARSGAHWIVWPETAIEVHLDKVNKIDRTDKREGLAPAVSHVFADHPDRWLIAGAPREVTTATGSDFYNSAVLIDGNGQIVDLYDKRTLYPLSEYVPGWVIAIPGASRVLASQLRWAPYSRGRDGRSLLAAPVPVGVMICVEGIDPRIARASVRDGAEVLVQLANDAVIPGAAAAAQHFAITRFRAVETRRSLIRASNRGISAILAASGRVLSRTDPGHPGIAFERIVPARGATPFVRGGWLFPWLCVGVVLLSASSGWWRRPSRPGA